VSRSLEQFFPIFRVYASTLWMAMGAAVLVGLVAALFPFYRAVHIRIAEGLRGVD
jgi:putative ABC transport system permease protein